MKKRYAVFGLSIVLALALAVPALGGPTNPIASISASAKSIANKALKKAKAAQTAANNAQSTANAASSAASNAQKTADGAQKTGEAAQKTGEAAQKTANTAQGTATTALSTANTAKSTADSAKSTATTALNTANEKMSGEERIEGVASTTLATVACPGGKVPTGGGFIITGIDNDAATATESTQYLNGWIVIADQIEGTSGSSWGTVATVNCAASP